MPEDQPLIGRTISHYRVIEKLGGGGMGVVYKAEDLKLGRLVALKFLPDNLAKDRQALTRFEREAKAASALNHPNICTIYEIDDQHGEPFIAMEYIAGTTLEQMTIDGGLPLDISMKYAAEIADALAAAHSAGIIHRDLKPANILISEDRRVKLLDFGLAKFIEPVTPVAETATLRTSPGAIMGTAAYMSPEQAEGREVDARSDIFSYGLVLYEMLSGQRAFRGETWVSTLAAILHDQPRHLRDIRPEIPVFIEQVVARCLRKDPAQRFQTVLEVKKALVETHSPVNTTAEPASIAVLPFVNLSADKENEYFGDGLAEEIINALTKLPELRVIARASAFAFRGKEHGLRSIAQTLKVGTILEGSVRRAGNRIRVTVQLIQVADESHLWTERYDREMTDIFAIQDEISQSIANALKIKFAAPQLRKTNIEAFQSYLKGLYWYQRYNPESLAKAKDAFEQALVHDPEYAPAYAGLAVFYYGMGALCMKRMIDMAPLAKSAAEKALAIDPTLSEAHSVLGLVAGAVEYDWKLAEHYFQKAMTDDPIPPLVRLRYGLYFLVPQRRFEEAVDQFRRALETDPLSMMVHFALSFALYCERRYHDAIQHAARAVDLYPDYWLVHFAMGLAQCQIGSIQTSIESLEKCVQLSPSFTLATGFLAAAYARTGNPGHAEKLMDEVRARGSKHYVSPACFGVYYAALGEAEKMFDSLTAAVAERDPSLTRMDSEPYFDPFRADPRYLSLMAMMHLG